MEEATVASTVESVFDRAALDADILLNELAQIHDGTSREFIEDARQLETGISELTALVGEDTVVTGIEMTELNIDDDLPVNSVNYALPAITLHSLNECGNATPRQRLKTLSGLFLNPRNIPAILEAINDDDLDSYYFEVLYQPHSKINYWRMTFPLQYILTHSTPSNGVTTPELKEEMKNQHPSIFTSDSQVGGAVKELREIPLVKQGREGRAYAYWSIDELSHSDAQDAFTDRFDAVQDTVRDHINRYYEVPGSDDEDDDRDAEESNDKVQMTTLCDFN